MLLTDLRELKEELDIPPGDKSEDVKLNFLLETASQWIEEVLNRPGLSYKQRTEYYGGTGTQKLLLRSRPAYYDANRPVQVFLDEGAYFGSSPSAFTASDAQLTYGVDFCLKIDQDDGVSSRSAILVRINNVWPRPQVRMGGVLSPFLGESFGAIKIVYYGGYLVDNLPPVFRTACNLLIARLRYVLPLGMELNSDSYIDKSVGIVNSEKQKLLALVVPMLASYRNWKF